MEISKDHSRQSVKLAVVGLSPSGEEAPFEDYSWEVWSLPWFPYPRVDRWFEIHDYWATGGYYKCGKTRAEIVEWLNALETPVFMSESHADIPKSMAYPFDGVRRLLGKALNTSKDEPYLESSIAAMLGCACLYLRPGDTMGLWGVDVMDGYSEQRPNIEYILGFLRGRGVKIIVHPGSKLLTTEHLPGRYGK